MGQTYAATAAARLARLQSLEGTMAQVWVQANPGYYAELAQRHRAGVSPTPAS